MPELDDAVQVAVELGGACALRRGDTVACWGSNLFGGLGNGGTEDSQVPVPVVGLADVVSLAATYDSARHFCAVRATDGIACWGSNFSGVLGDGTTSQFRNSPVPVVVLPE